GNQHFIGLPAAVPLPPYQFVAFQPETVAAAPVVPQALPGPSAAPMAYTAPVSYAAPASVSAASAASGVLPPPPPPLPPGGRGLRRSTVATIAVSLLIGLGAAAYLVHSQRPVPSSVRLVSAKRGDAYEAPQRLFTPDDPEAETEPPAPKKFPTDSAIELFLERSYLAHVMVVTYDENDKSISAGTGVVVSADGLVVTSMDTTKLGVKATVFTGKGKWYHTRRPAVVDAGANLALFKFDDVSLTPFDLGESESMIAGSPALIHIGGQTVSSVWKVRMDERPAGSSMASSGLPNGGRLISFPTGTHGSFGSPVLDRSMKLVGLVAYIPLGIRSPSTTQCISVEAVRDLLNKYHESPPPPEPPSAQELADEADTGYRDDPDAKVLFDLGGKREWRKAVDVGRTLVKRYPGSPEAHLQLGNAYLGSGDGAAAEPILRRGLELSPEESRFLVLLGLALEKQKKLAKAREFYKKATESESTQASAWAMLAYSHLKLGELKEAIPAMEGLRKFDRKAFDGIVEDLQQMGDSDSEARYVLRYFEKRDREGR
ncbi:MAG: serine protease, partial [Verrucomicrobiaceae bacterium]